MTVGLPSIINTPQSQIPLPANYKRAQSTCKKPWWRKVVPYLAFLIAFSTAMALLIVWSEATAMRRQAFDANMTKDHILDRVSMDNPQLIGYIRNFHLKNTTHQEPLVSNQTSEEKYISSLLKGKRDGIYVEYISRLGAVSSTGWLESHLNWRGLLILTDTRSFVEVSRSTRNPKSRVLHACLSTDKYTKEITYHQDAEVQVTKLIEGPNSLVSSEDNAPTTRLKCFPLYSILLAYNSTTLDYLSLDSSDVQDGQVLDTILWEVMKITVLSIHCSPHHGESETNSLINKLKNRRYKFMYKTDNGKLIFLYNTLHKI